MRRRARLPMFLVIAAAIPWMLLCCGGEEPTSTTPRSAPEEAAPVGALELVFPYGSEKKEWISEVTRSFNAGNNRSSSGKPIFVRALPMGSGESVNEILEGRLEAHLVSPASAAFFQLGNAASRTKTGSPLVEKTRDLVLSPVVIAMWEPMAKAIGFGERPLGWSDILALAQDEKGWGAHGFPQWGRFKFGHTHPEYSNSGLISLLAEVYAATGKKNGLTLDDIRKPETADFLAKIERSIVHYGSSTGFFGRKMFANGPGYLSAAVLYENMIIESRDSTKHKDLPFPIVAIYPKEGTFWSDHPVGIVNRPWVTAEHAAAANAYIEYLLARPQQERAIAYGFRPSDPLIPVSSPIDADHGVDPQEPKTTLQAPGADVMNAIIDLWRQHKRHANVTLVFDTSGSMKESERLQNAKLGARELINRLGVGDTFSFLQFNQSPRWLLTSAPVAESRDKALAILPTLIADGGTALYDAIASAYDQIQSRQDPERISAIVVLTDGADRNSKMGLQALLEHIRYDNEGLAIRIFTIGYGASANASELKDIAERNQAKFYEGSPENIREVLKDISTFF